MDLSQIIKFLLEHLPVLAPVLPFIGFYLWLRGKQEELAEKNMTVAAAEALLEQRILTFTEDKVRRAFVETVILYHINALVIVGDNSRCEIIKICLERERFLNKIDRLFGGPLISVLAFLLAACTLLMALLGVSAQGAVVICGISLIVALGVHVIFSQWLIEVKRAFTILRSETV